jgi:flagellar export protein FliJ
MTDERFSLETVLKIREAEQERCEKELGRIGRERARERESGLLIRREREEVLAAFSGDSIDRGAANRIAFYAWLESVGVKIEMQDRRALTLEAEYEKVHMAWRRARTEKEKIRILRDRFQGEQRSRERMVEERSLDAWVLSRGSGRPDRGSE